MRISHWSSDVCSSDLHFKQGAMPHFPVPTVMGHEAAGVVEKVGKNVRDLQPGDHVVACNTIYCGTCKQCLYGRPHLCLDRMGPAARRPKGSSTRLSANGEKRTDSRPVGKEGVSRGKT